MFRLSNYLQKHLKGYIDFDAFVLLAIIPRKKKDAVVLLAPKYEHEYCYFAMQSGGNHTYHSCLDNMLDAASKIGISKFKLWRCRKRYERYKRSGRI